MSRLTQTERILGFERKKGSTAGQDLAKFLDNLLNDKTEKREGMAAPKTWKQWAQTIFPEFYNKPFSVHQEVAWEWLWKAKKGDQLINCLPRGTGKSVFNISALIYLACELRVVRYAIFLENTQTQADVQLSGRLRAILERSTTMPIYYPGAEKPSISVITGANKAWNRQRLETDYFIAESFGLDVAIAGRGSVVENEKGKLVDARIDLLIMGDVDDRHDSLARIQKKIEILTEEFFPAGSGSDMFILWGQNLIHANSILNQIKEGELKILRRAYFNGPVPAIKNLTYESLWDNKLEKEVYRITGGEPTWEAGLNLIDAENVMNTGGDVAFLGAYQNEVTKYEGLVYGNFTNDNLLIKEPDPFVPTVDGWDEGYYPDPRVILFAQYYKNEGKLFYFDEIVAYKELAQTTVDLVMGRYRRGWPLEEYAIDAAKKNGLGDQLEKRESLPYLTIWWDLDKEIVTAINDSGLSYAICEGKEKGTWELKDKWILDESVSHIVRRVTRGRENEVKNRVELMPAGWYLKNGWRSNLVRGNSSIRYSVHAGLRYGERGFVEHPEKVIGKSGENEIASRFRMSPAPVATVQPKVIARVEQLRNLICSGSSSKIRRILVHPERCPTLVKEMKKTYKMGAKGVPEDKDNHACDTAGYIAWYKFPKLDSKIKTEDKEED